LLNATRSSKTQRRFHDPLVGDLTLNYYALELPAATSDSDP